MRVSTRTRYDFSRIVFIGTNLLGVLLSLSLVTRYVRNRVAVDSPTVRSSGSNVPISAVAHDGIKKNDSIARTSKIGRQYDFTGGVKSDDIVTTFPLNVAAKVIDVPNPFVPYILRPVLISVGTRLTFLHFMLSKTNKGKFKALPDMSNQQGVVEKDNLKLHMCSSVREAYGASYLTTKQHLLSVKSEAYNLTWVNVEMASFIYMQENDKFYTHPNSEGVVMQSLDVLDFSVIHLPSFLRRERKYRRKRENFPEFFEALEKVSAQVDPNSPASHKIQYSSEAQRTVVVMPLSLAYYHLPSYPDKHVKASFWSFYEFIPNIVVVVTNQHDANWCKNVSGLPFYDVIVVSNLPKLSALAVSATLQVKKRLLNGVYYFDFVFFTEADQVLISRELPLMYEHLKRYPGHMMIPHRLMPYSNVTIGEVHKRDITITENEWMTQSCCMPRQNCVERKSWLSIKDPAVPVINYYGLYVPLGNVNFLDEMYRACKLTSYIGEYCP